HRLSLHDALPILGADKSVHLNDESRHGSDVVQAAWAIANVLGGIEGTELVICGNEATDGRMGSLPAILAEYLGLPQVTHMRTLEVSGDAVKGERETDEGLVDIEASLPCVVSINEKMNEPRFPSFKGIMATKKKPVEVMKLSHTNIEAAQVDKDNATKQDTPTTMKPQRTAGEKVTDEGEGGKDIVNFLVEQKMIRSRSPP